MQLHEKLRALREERGLRLKDIAIRCDISVPYLSDIERGRANPSLDTLKTVALGYGISVQNILENVDHYGETTRPSLPLGLGELLADPVLSVGIMPEWIQTGRQICLDSVPIPLSQNREDLAHSG